MYLIPKIYEKLITSLSKTDNFTMLIRNYTEFENRLISNIMRIQILGPLI